MLGHVEMCSLDWLMFYRNYNDTHVFVSSVSKILTEAEMYNVTHGDDDDTHDDNEWRRFRW